MSENLTPGTIPICFLVSTIVYVLDMGYCDFHGATLQVELAGPCPINIRILISPTTLCSVYRATGCGTLGSTRQITSGPYRSGRVGLPPFKCTGWVPLYVHIYVQEDVRAGIVSKTSWELYPIKCNIKYTYTYKLNYNLQYQLRYPFNYKYIYKFTYILNVYLSLNSYKILRPNFCKNF